MQSARPTWWLVGMGLHQVRSSASVHATGTGPPADCSHDKNSHTQSRAGIKAGTGHAYRVGARGCVVAAKVSRPQQQTHQHTQLQGRVSRAHGGR